MIAKPVFSILKSNYRTLSHQIHACTMPFPNTCAIRMSEALVKTNQAFFEAFKNSGKNVCPHGYMRGAQDLGAVLNSPQVFGTRSYGWSGKPNGTAPANIQGAKGIVCYMDIPGFSGQGHIDLWDGSSEVGAAYWDAKTIWVWRLT